MRLGSPKLWSVLNDSLICNCVGCEKLMGDFEVGEKHCLDRILGQIDAGSGIEEILK